MGEGGESAGNGLSEKDLVNTSLHQTFDQDKELLDHFRSDPNLAPFINKLSPGAYNLIAEQLSKQGSAGEVILTSVSDELRQHTEIARFCQEVFVNGDQTLLKTKSQAQLRKLTADYFSGISLFNIRERNQRRQKLESFRKFVYEQKVVRNEYQQHLSEMKSPRESGIATSFGTPDIVVQGDTYVYASFDKIPHNMSRGANYELDKPEALIRGELVMQDIANLVHGYEHLLQRYIENIFDYQQGQEILALYLAMVFDNPTQAEEFIAHNNHPKFAQNWDREGMQSRTSLYIKDKELAEQEAELLRSRMKQMRDIYGLEPPLSLEVRVRGHCKATPIKSQTESEDDGQLVPTGKKWGTHKKV